MPPDYEASLSLLLRLRGLHWYFVEKVLKALTIRWLDSSPDIVDDAVKYVIFLVDANQLFDIALGMYDFSLVIMIAQHAQKASVLYIIHDGDKPLNLMQDPREYLPFLRELRALDKYYQRFRIDDHLKRFESALKNLNLAGRSVFTKT